MSPPKTTRSSPLSVAQTTPENGSDFATRFQPPKREKGVNLLPCLHSRFQDYDKAATFHIHMPANELKSLLDVDGFGTTADHLDVWGEGESAKSALAPDCRHHVRRFARTPSPPRRRRRRWLSALLLLPVGRCAVPGCPPHRPYSVAAAIYSTQRSSQRASESVRFVGRSRSQ